MPIENAVYYNAAWTPENIHMGLGLGQQQPLGSSAGEELPRNVGLGVSSPADSAQQGGIPPLMERYHAAQLRREGLACAIQALAPCRDPETLVNAARVFEAYLSGRDSPS